MQSNQDTEQLFHDLEQRHIFLRKENELICIERDNLKSQITQYQLKNETLNVRIDEVEILLSKCTDKLKQKEYELENLTVTHAELNDRLNRRMEECERLRGEVKAQSSEILSTQNKLKEYITTLTESQSNLLPLQLEVAKSTHEKQLLEKRVEQLEEELKKKNIKTRDTINQLNDKIRELDATNYEKVKELQDAEKMIASLKDQIKTYEEKVDQSMKKCTESENEKIQQYGELTKEIEGLKRIADLYKRYFEEATSKVEELEQAAVAKNEAFQIKYNQFKENIEKQVQERESALLEEQKQLQNHVKELEDQLENIRYQSLQTAIVPLDDDQDSSKLPGFISPVKFTRLNHIEGLSVTDLYGRIVEVERELFAEKNKRKETELYLNQVLKDIESKAPIIASQRRDYNRIVESHSKLTAKLDQLAAEGNHMKTKLKEMEKERDAAIDEAKVLETHNADLCSQLQNLLRHSMSSQRGGDSQEVMEKESHKTASGVISDYLVPYKDIAELQLRNAELLRVVRKLSQQEEGRLRGDTNEGDMNISNETDTRMQTPGGQLVIRKQPNGSETENVALQKAIAELKSMKEARKRTEDMVLSLVQQRDMYKAMLEQADSSLAMKASTYLEAEEEISRSQSTLSTPGLMSPNTVQQGTSQKLRDLQWKLTQSEEEKRRLTDRLSKLEEAEKMLHESLEKVRGDNNTFRLDAARAMSDANFQKERADRLESTIQLMSVEKNSIQDRRLDLEKTVQFMENELRNKQELLRQSQDELTSVFDKLRRFEIELEVIKASETRLQSQLQEAREDNKRRTVLEEYVRRIDGEVNSRMEEDKRALIEEKEASMKAYAALRKQFDEKVLMDEQKIIFAAEELRTLRSKLETKLHELSIANESLSRETATCHAAQERCKLLEKQLEITNERFGNLQGKSIVDSIANEDAITASIELDRCKAELTAVKDQLVAAETHVDQFQKISAKNETLLKDLTIRSNESMAQKEKELETLRNEITKHSTELQDHRSQSLILLKELEELKLQLKSQSNVVMEQEKEWLAKVDRVEKQSEQYKNQMEVLKSDVEKFQASAKFAHSNYERELQLHARVERELREKEDELDAIRQELHVTQQSMAQLSADSIHREKELSESKLSAFKESEGLKQELAELRKTNDFLHSTVQSLGIQVEKLQHQRVSAALIEADSNRKNVNNMISNDGTIMDTQLPDTGAVLTKEEAEELMNSSSEMREVLKYMKREKDLLEAKLSLIEMENNRHVNELTATTRALDEARIELKMEIERRPNLRNESEFDKLMQEVTQLNIIRESNAHLRTENEVLLKKTKDFTDEIHLLRSKYAPIEDELRRTKAEKEALEIANEQLNKDIEYWRDRLQKLVSRYDEIDPEEHRLVKLKLEETSKLLEETKKSLEQKSTEFAELMRVKEAELSALKTTYNTLENNNQGLRNRLRDFKTKLEDNDRKLKESNRQCTSLESLVTTYNEQIQSQEKQIIGLNQDVQNAKSEASKVQEQLLSTMSTQKEVPAPAKDTVPSAVPSVVPVPPLSNSDGDGKNAAVGTSVVPNKKRDRQSQENSSETSSLLPSSTLDTSATAATATAIGTIPSRPSAEKQKLLLREALLKKKQLLNQQSKAILATIAEHAAAPTTDKITAEVAPEKVTTMEVEKSTVPASEVSLESNTAATGTTINQPPPKKSKIVPPVKRLPKVAQVPSTSEVNKTTTDETSSIVPESTVSKPMEMEPPHSNAATMDTQAPLSIDTGVAPQTESAAAAAAAIESESNEAVATQLLSNPPDLAVMDTQELPPELPPVPATTGSTSTNAQSSFLGFAVGRGKMSVPTGITPGNDFNQAKTNPFAQLAATSNLVASSKPPAGKTASIFGSEFNNSNVSFGQTASSNNVMKSSNIGFGFQTTNSTSQRVDENSEIMHEEISDENLRGENFDAFGEDSGAGFETVQTDRHDAGIDQPETRTQSSVASKNPFLNPFTGSNTGSFLMSSNQTSSSNNQMSFLNQSSTSIPVIGSGKGSLPVPALLTPGASAVDKNSITPAISIQTGKSIFKSQAPFSLYKPTSSDTTNSMLLSSASNDGMISSSVFSQGIRPLLPATPLKPMSGEGDGVPTRNPMGSQINPTFDNSVASSFFTSAPTSDDSNNGMPSIGGEFVPTDDSTVKRSNLLSSDTMPSGTNTFIQNTANPQSEVQPFAGGIPPALLEGLSGAEAIQKKKEWRQQKYNAQANAAAGGIAFPGIVPPGNLTQTSAVQLNPVASAHSSGIPQRGGALRGRGRRGGRGPIPVSQPLDSVTEVTPAKETDKGNDKEENNS